MAEGHISGFSPSFLFNVKATAQLLESVRGQAAVFTRCEAQSSVLSVPLH